MNTRTLQLLSLLFFILVLNIAGCQREGAADKTQSPQPASTVDQAAQQAVDAIKTPMDKARGVEGTLEKAAEREAQTIKEGGNN